MRAMGEFKIIVKKNAAAMPSMQEIPAWFLDPEAVAPCPCGRMPDGPTFIYEGESELKRWFHKRCVGFLRHELDEDELERFEAWKNQIEED